MSCCLVALGSNVGDRAEQLDRATRLLAGCPGIEVEAASSYHANRSVGGPAGQGDFLNAALSCKTSLSPEAFFQALRHIEDQLGRTRTVHWGPRTIDLDLLLYDTLIQESSALILPHPRMAFRRFVLTPAAEIAGQMIHAPTGWTVRQLLDRLDTAPNYLALTGGRTDFRLEIVRRVAARLGCQYISDPAARDFESYAAGSGVGRDPTRHLEFLSGRLSVLDASTIGFGRSTPDRFVISNFWIGESLALATVGRSVEESTRFDEAWKLVPDSYMKPKLLVFLVSGDKVSGESPEEGWSAFQRELRQIALRPKQAPTLLWPDLDPQSTADEIVAAILAMQ